MNSAGSKKIRVSSPENHDDFSEKVPVPMKISKVETAYYNLYFCMGFQLYFIAIFNR